MDYQRPNRKVTAEAVTEVRTQAESVKLLKDWMLKPGHEDWLLVLDNFDDIRVNIDYFLPVGASGSILITTRDRNVIGSVATSGFPLTAMDSLEAELLFLGIQSPGAGPNQQRPTCDPEHQGLKPVLEELQCFPLAIDQAASFIRENSPMTLHEYLTYLKPRSADRERLLRFKQANPTYPDSVMTTWEISLQSLERKEPRASTILQLLGFLDHSFISEELLTAVTKRIPWMFDATLVGKQLPSKYQTQIALLEDGVGFRIAIGTLVSLSLLQRHLTGPTLHVHPLVHEWTRVRLNPYPEQQARFTIMASIILYQYLPSEMIICLDYQPTSISEGVFHRIGQVSHHLRGVLVNLGDYAIHTTTIPLECFMLCEVCFLAGLSRFPFHQFDISTALSENLDRIIKLVISRLAHDQMPMAYFIHKVILLLKGNLKQKYSLTPTSKMADTFESLNFNYSRAAFPDDFLMLLSSSIVEVCDTLDHSIPDKLSHGNERHREVARDRKERRRHIKYRLLESLRKLLSSIEPLSTLLRRNDLVIKNRLLRVMTPQDFATQNWLDVKQELSSEDLNHLGFGEKAHYLCFLAKLLWEYQGPRQFSDLQYVFSSVAGECSSMRLRARRSTVLRREKASIHAMSRSSYISSSFGREVSKSESKIDADLITPLSYIWETTLLVAQTMSDPIQQWRLSRIGNFHIGSLDLSQRRWSLELVSSVGKIYKRVRADQGDKTGTNALILNHFSDLSVGYCLMTIYVNLEDWERLQRELLKILQCNDVLRFCSTLKSFPWETQSVPSVQRNVSSPPPSFVHQKNDNESFWLFEAARNLVTGQVWQTWGASGTSSQRELVIKRQEPEVQTQNKAAEIEARLNSAVSQRNSREPVHVRSSLSRLQRLGIPESCNCIADPDVGSAIAHFFTLAQKKEILNKVEAHDLQLLIRVVARMSPDSSAKYLGNLQIIHRLSQIFSSKISESMDSDYASGASKYLDESPSGSSDDKDDEEGYEDDDLDTNASITQFDWGW